jgi:hypothetical protein
MPQISINAGGRDYNPLFKHSFGLAYQSESRLEKLFIFGFFRFVINKPFRVNGIGGATFFLFNEPLASRAERRSAFQIHMTEAAVFGAELFRFSHERRVGCGLNCQRDDCCNNESQYYDAFDPVHLILSGVLKL